MSNQIIFLNNKKFLSELTKKKMGADLLELAINTPKRFLESVSQKQPMEYIPLLSKKEIREDFFKKGIIKKVFDYLNG